MSIKKTSVKTLRRTAGFLLLALVGCKGEPTVPSVATALAANSAVTVTGVVGAPVAPPPSVIVTDQNGSPMAGASVTFSVVSGGGSVSGATVTTNGSGIATIGSWTLGPVAGSNVLSAASGTLTVVTFTATSTAGVAASLAKNVGDNQTAPPGSAVPIPPSVIVKDANGNLKAGISVTFAVASGGGSITGATAVTNAAGIATVGSWTLGAAVGAANSLTATVPGVPSVTFTATAISSACTSRATHTFGTVTSGMFAAGDCTLPDGGFIDFYTTTIPAAGAYQFRQGAAFDTYLVLGTVDGKTIGENDDEVETSTNSGIKALLPAGEYLLGPGTFRPGVTGNYEISSATASNDVASCEIVFVVKNITTMQNIATTDCNLANASATPIYSDRYFIFLAAGTSVTITMASTALDSFLQLVRLDGLVVSENDNIDTTTKDARIMFTATQTNYYAIFARSVPTTAVGAYTLTIQ